MMDFGRLDAASLDAIDGLCRRGVADPPSRAELAAALFAPDQPAIVHGDPDVAVVATVAGAGGAHIRLLVVDPRRRGRGLGHALVEEAEADARSLGQTSLITGADAPYFLWPGVPTDRTELCALFERHHYARIETNYDVRIDLEDLPPDPGGHRLAAPTDADRVAGFMDDHWVNWRPEVVRALGKGNLVVADDATGLAAFCAFEVNRVGYLGPVAVRPDLIGSGAGKSVLLGALWELRRRGRRRVEVSWVGPLVPYARVGGRISTLYFVYRRALA